MARLLLTWIGTKDFEGTERGKTPGPVSESVAAFSFDEIHRPTEVVLQPELDAHVLGQAGCFPELDQDVYVAFRRGFIAGRRSKEIEGADAEAFLQLLPVRGQEADHLVTLHDWKYIPRRMS